MYVYIYIYEAPEGVLLKILLYIYKNKYGFIFMRPQKGYYYKKNMAIYFLRPHIGIRVITKKKYCCIFMRLSKGYYQKYNYVFMRVKKG